MDKLKAIIVDDEIHCVETLEWQLKHYCPQVAILATCTRPLDAVNSIKTLEPDVVFLDVEMPKMNGFQLLKTVEEANFGVIFTTAYDQFAVQAFKVSAIDYLVKPIDEDELILAVEKAVKSCKVNQNISLNFLLEQIESNKISDQLYIPNLNGLEFIEKNRILRCESDSNYSTIFLTNDEKIVVSKTLKNLEELMPEKRFFRVHHSHIVNLNFVKKYVKGDGGHLGMKDGTIVPVSRGKKQALLHFLQR